MPNNAAVKVLIEAVQSAVQNESAELGPEYRQKLADFEATSVALANDLAAGTITLAEAEAAAKREYEAIKSTLLAGAIDVRHRAAGAALNVAWAVLPKLLALLI